MLMRLATYVTIDVQIVTKKDRKPLWFRSYQIYAVLFILDHLHLVFQWRSKFRQDPFLYP